ncbi:lysophospholipid acyltransferase family protein [Rhodovulum sp. DZ06]|uniref:lysophospholipid acyltransferase family protein n=1 Tax=Rhodovulum sp. DZ06 TaxID=3425126 RepID=UPI003D34E511
MAVQYLRSLVFFVWMYGLMAVMGVLGAPFAIASRRGASRVMWLYTEIVLRSMALICGLRAEVRGPVPTGEVVVASKHQSFLDILILFNALNDARFVMKRSLRWTPFLGVYAMRIGCAPVNRGAGAKAAQGLADHAEARRGSNGQTIIFPQGTRVAPGATAPYKGGVHGMAEALNVPVIPAATNAGLFWPRLGILRKPGVAVVEFLPELEPGLARKEMTRALEAVIEPASDALAAEARAADPRL